MRRSSPGARRTAPAVVGGDREAQAEAIMRACAFKAAVVGDDEREEKPNDGRALLNLGHTFGHALEAEYGYDGGLLHGEGVAVGLGLAFRLSARLGHCARGGRGPRGVACRGDGHAGGAAHAEPAVLGRDADRAYAARQEGARRRAEVRAGARDRPGVHRARRAAGGGDRSAARRGMHRVYGARHREPPLGGVAIHVWTAPCLQVDRSGLFGSDSLASICPACWCGRRTAGQDGFRGGSSKQRAAVGRHWIARSVSRLGSIDHTICSLLLQAPACSPRQAARCRSWLDLCRCRSPSGVRLPWRRLGA